MKVLGSLLTLLLTGSLIFYLSINTNLFPQVRDNLYFSLCDTPKKYRVGSIDDRFNLSKEQVNRDVKEAADIWNNVYGKQLFKEADSAKLTINFVYDERQTLSNQINQLENKLGESKKTLDPALTDFQNKSADFKNRREALNAEIEAWNKQGGAPPDVYDKLLQKQKDLQAEADRLNEEAKKLKISTQNYNADINNLHQTVDTFNASLQNKPEEGIYNPQTEEIDIYFNFSQKERVHTLAHELGHSIGMDHIANKEAIMFHFSNENIKPTQEDIDQLNRICQEKPVWEPYILKLKLLFNYYKFVFENNIS